MVDLEKKLRELQREIASTNLENEALRALLSGEQELREDRSVEETTALLLVNDDLKQSVVVADEERKKGKKQKEFAEMQVSALDRIVNDSKQRIQDLMNQISQSKQHTQEQIARLDQEVKNLNVENKQLRANKEKSEAQMKGLERDLVQIISQERDVEA